MKTISEYIIESTEEKIDLPYDFYIYNDGPKNVGFKITKSSIRKMFRGCFGTNMFSCLLPLAADSIRYYDKPDEHSTKNWTELPKFDEYKVSSLWISDKRGESNDWRGWNDTMDTFLLGLKPYIKHGKISCTLQKTEHTWGKNTEKCLEIVVNDEAFNKDREEKIAEMKDESNLQKWKADKEARDKEWEEDMKRHREEQARKKKEFDDWYNSLSDGEKESWARGYGQGRYMGD